MAIYGVDRNPQPIHTHSQKTDYPKDRIKHNRFDDMLTSGISKSGTADPELAESSNQTVNADTGIGFSSIRPIIHADPTAAAHALSEPSGVLSPEQIAMLKKRYDIQNMSTSELRKLADELAEMGIISKGVAATAEMRPATPATTIFICKGQEDPYDQPFRDFLNYFRSGNILDYLDAAMKESDWSQDMINEAMSGNPNIKISDSNTSDIAEFKVANSNLKAAHQTLRDVISQLL